MLGGVISLHVLVEGSLVWGQLVAERALVAEVSLNVAVLDMADKVGLNELVAGHVPSTLNKFAAENTHQSARR